MSRADSLEEEVLLVLGGKTKLGPCFIPITRKVGKKLGRLLTLLLGVTLFLCPVYLRKYQSFSFFTSLSL
jgi:hypothetical protein